MSSGDESDRPAADATTRKRRVRGGHRASVTRILKDIPEALARADVARLKQLKQSLVSKLGILTKLDEELIDAVEVDQIDEEIEQADIIREEVSLAVISLEEALEIIVRSPEPRPRKVTSPGSPELSVEEGRRPSIRDSLAATSSHTTSLPNSSDSTTSTVVSVVVATPSSVSDIMATTAPVLPGRLIGTHHAIPSPGTLGSLTSSSSTTVTSVPSPVPYPGISAPSTTVPFTLPSTFDPYYTHDTRAPSTGMPWVSSSLYPTLPETTTRSIDAHGLAPPTYMTSLPTSDLSPAVGMLPPSTLAMPHRLSASTHPVSTATIHVKLPKLTLKKFSGDLTKWATFWDSFHSSYPSESNFV